VRKPLALLVALVSCTGLGLGQTPRQPGFVRGVVVANEPGDLEVKSSSQDLYYHYRTDNKTWIEREERRIRVSDLRPGEILEVVSDRDPQLVRYARLVHVIAKLTPRPVNVSPNEVFRLPRNQPARPVAAEPVLLSYSGIISARDGSKLTLRTRMDGEIAVILRDDTKLVYGGQNAAGPDFGVNTRVFMRGASNREGVIEAFEIVWGAMLKPEEPRD
jgi:hypothetical protein